MMVRYSVDRAAGCSGPDWHPVPGAYCALRMSAGIDPSGQVRGIELYPECEYATDVHDVFDIDELVRYIKFRDVLAEELRRSQG